MAWRLGRLWLAGGVGGVGAAGVLVGGGVGAWVGDGAGAASGAQVGAGEVTGPGTALATIRTGRATMMIPATASTTATIQITRVPTMAQWTIPAVTTPPPWPLTTIRAQSPNRKARRTIIRTPATSILRGRPSYSI